MDHDKGSREQSPDESSPKISSWPPQRSGLPYKTIVPRSGSSSLRPGAGSGTPKSGRSDDATNTMFRSPSNMDQYLSMNRVTSVSGSSGPMQCGYLRGMAGLPSENPASASRRPGGFAGDIPLNEYSAYGDMRSASIETERTSLDVDDKKPRRLTKVDTVVSNLSNLSLERDSQDSGREQAGASGRSSGEIPPRTASDRFRARLREPGSPARSSPRAIRSQEASSPNRRTPSKRMRTRQDDEAEGRTAAAVYPLEQGTPKKSRLEGMLSVSPDTKMLSISPDNKTSPSRPRHRAASPSSAHGPHHSPPRPNTGLLHPELQRSGRPSPQRKPSRIEGEPQIQGLRPERPQLGIPHYASALDPRQRAGDDESDTDWHARRPLPVDMGSCQPALNYPRSQVRSPRRSPAHPSPRSVVAKAPETRSPRSKRPSP